MSNMSYCRFENTLNDLEDCAEHIHDMDLSEREEKCRIRLIEMCREIADEDEMNGEDSDV